MVFHDAERLFLPFVLEIICWFNQLKLPGSSSDPPALLYGSLIQLTLFAYFISSRLGEYLLKRNLPFKFSGLEASSSETAFPYMTAICFECGLGAHHARILC
jgi:hypothetical protein